MGLLRNITLIASCFLLCALIIRTGRNLKTPGTPALFAMIVFFAVWVIGNLIDANAGNLKWMLWGRNITQIGVFFTPLCTLYFSADYTANRKLRVFAYIATAVQLASVLLVFTDQYHHIMRESVTVQVDPVFGSAIAVRSTKIATVLIAFNFCLPLVAVVNLVIFTRTVSARFRRSIWMIIVSIVLTFVAAAVQSTILSEIGINITIPVLSLPCLVLISYVVLRSGFIGVAPIAFSKVFDVIDQGIIIVDENGMVIEHNQRASELMDAIGHHVGLKTGSNIKRLIAHGEDADGEGFSVNRLPSELRSAQRNCYVSMASHALEPFHGKLVGYAVVLTDITLLKLRAEIDPLTQIYNREGLNNAFSDLQKNAGRNPSLCAMVIDLDNFKSINDTYGHLGGDAALNDFVETAQGMLPSDSFMGRIGGDEFVLILPADIDAATIFAKQLQSLVSERIVSYMEHQIQYTISIGVAACPNADCTLSALIHQADMSLYRAKEQGKNTISM